MSPIAFWRIRFKGVFSIQKVVLIALTTSFSLGFLHGAALRNESFALTVNDGSSYTAYVILATAAGVIVFSEEEGYRFMPFEKIEALGI